MQQQRQQPQPQQQQQQPQQKQQPQKQQPQKQQQPQEPQEEQPQQQQKQQSRGQLESCFYCSTSMGNRCSRLLEKLAQLEFRWGWCAGAGRGQSHLAQSERSGFLRDPMEKESSNIGCRISTWELLL
ncbi:hypothetical protein WISP_00707 [Willisornis vidua]|uniref:Uncharacterized protein n=1 Tax=Willisornis vidua TaxID=1566151 RepID=A0ABQ9DV51_9PASS|nr:hypothetical protein WISP_00707 [Willisornis vidua]